MCFFFIKVMISKINEKWSPYLSQGFFLESEQHIPLTLLCGNQVDYIHSHYRLVNNPHMYRLLNQL